MASLMNRPSPIQRIRRALRKHGAMGSSRILGARVKERLFPTAAPVHHFDLRHGVDTSGLLYARELRSGHANDPYVTAYYGTSPSLFRGVIAQWEQTLAGTGYRLFDFSLVDMGCGKGRVLMMASDLPFRSIVGVELNPGLVATAQANLVRWNTSPHACEITVFVADSVAALAAIAPRLAGMPMLLYLYNPFDEPVMRPLLDRLVALSRERSAPIDILYIHPVHAELFKRTPGMALTWSGDIPITQEDTAVDAFQSTGQDVKIYRLAA